MLFFSSPFFPALYISTIESDPVLFLQANMAEMSRELCEILQSEELHRVVLEAPGPALAVRRGRAVAQLLHHDPHGLREVHCDL